MNIFKLIVFKAQLRNKFETKMFPFHVNGPTGFLSGNIRSQSINENMT